MRTLMYALVSLVMTSALLYGGPAWGNDAPPHVITSPEGQIKVVAVNAHQNRILGRKRFDALYELARALRFRPTAFNGGFEPSVAAPDVIILQEVRPSNIEILQHLLKQKFGYKYEIIGPSNSAATLVINTERITLQGEVTTWSDVCTDDQHPTDGRNSRDYEYAHLTENTSAAAFVVAGMHAAKNYSSTGLSDCFNRNIAELRHQLANETAPTIIGGDFNRRAVVEYHECDENEESDPQQWWSMMVTPDDGGRAYEDDVRSWNRAHHILMNDEWTHEQSAATLGCDGKSRDRRSRIDYLFSAGAGIAEAHADHPGWAGEEPGTRNRDNYKYSDHRWVWGRFAIAGPPQPARPTATPEHGGNIALTWSSVDGAEEYVVYRALRGHAYRAYRRVPSTETTFVDEGTQNGRVYRYAVAGTGGGAVGIESRPIYALADSRGPRVTGARPSPGATGIDPSSTIEVFTDEAIDPSSVGDHSIKVYAHGRRIAGFVFRAAARKIGFNPNHLAKGTTYRVVVRDLRDRLGNVGPRRQWSFTTVAPPPPPKRR